MEWYRNFRICASARSKYRTILEKCQAFATRGPFGGLLLGGALSHFATGYLPNFLELLTQSPFAFAMIGFAVAWVVAKIGKP